MSKGSQKNQPSRGPLKHGGAGGKRPRKEGGRSYTPSRDNNKSGGRKSGNRK